MNCQNFRHLTDEFIETGILSAEAESHAAECKECAAELKALKELRGALKADDTVKIPRDFNAKVWKKIGEPAPSLLPKLFSAGFFMKTAAAALIIMAGVVFVMNPKHDKVEVADKKADVQINTAKNDETQIKAKDADIRPEAVKTDTERVITAKTDNQTVIEKNDNGEKTVMAVTDGNTSSGGIKLMNSDTARVITENKSENSVSSASAEKSLRQGSMREPVEIRNNVIKPLTGETFGVKYLVGSAADIKVIIYDIKGAPVKVLVNAGQSEGVYEVYWNGTDDKGSFVGDGTYIAYIKTGLAEKKVKVAVVK